MTTLLVVLWFVLLLLLIVVASLKPPKSRHSWFELRRRSDGEELRRERLLPSVIVLQILTISILVALLAIIAFALWHWWVLFIVLVSILVIPPLTRIRSIRGLAQRTYERIEPRVLLFVETKQVGIWLGRASSSHDQKLESSEQLLHLIDTAGQVLTDNQKSIIRHGIDWHETSIGSVMTPRKRIETVKYSELIGPLVLNDLHGTGHKKFPVVKGDVDNIIGMLDITALVEVTASSQSQTAEKLMSSRVLRVDEDESLPRALELLQKSHEHLLVVLDQDGKTAGLVTLADITRSLLGSSDS